VASGVFRGRRPGFRRRRRGRLVVVIAVFGLSGAVVPGPAAAPPGPVPRAYQIGLIGDTGYTEGADRDLLAVRRHTGQFPLAFVVHDGDTQPSGSSCSDARLDYVEEVFDGFAAPFLYTPGDNEWLDCPEGSPHSRLAAIRRIYFPTDESLGRRRLTVQRQYPTFVENARWTKNGVWFATLDVPGPDGGGPAASADMAWLNSTFDGAAAAGAAGVMIIWQDDPFSDPSSRALVGLLKKRATTFGKPVVLVHGDTHLHRIDHPWPDVPTFTRVETFASDEGDRWVRGLVDPASPRVFSFSAEAAR
jgi:hypothetical protein